MARILCEQLRDRLGQTYIGGNTMDAILSNHFTSMNERELETHAVIRGYSNALHDLNTRMLNWLQQDFDYKTRSKTDLQKDLSLQLNRLETHLYLWIAKYNVWIPPIPHHSLVYLKDEAYHGTGFPKALEGSLVRFLEVRHHTTFPFNEKR